MTENELLLFDWLTPDEQESAVEMLSGSFEFWEIQHGLYHRFDAGIGGIGLELVESATDH